MTTPPVSPSVPDRQTCVSAEPAARFSSPGGDGPRVPRTDPQRPRRAQARRLPVPHRLAIAAERSGRRRTALHHLVTVDVTMARHLITAAGSGVSFTAFVAASVARAAAEQPGVHAYLDWRGRLVTHSHADVVVPVEVRTSPGPFAMPCVVRDADIRGVADISAELRAGAADPRSTKSGATFERWSRLARVPGLARAWYTLLGRSARGRGLIGTIAVTPAGTPGTGGGFAVVPSALMPLQVVIGGVTERPHATGTLIDRHEAVDLAVTFDHDIVDGASAGRFVARLRELIERAEVLRGR
jgi:pyruvate/2-oxoglutarate dehydrogenase complex dihydrolipoamide acyltransferase (E2) component